MRRLENETLPTYFRHRRFQSLVRQLNFYNFRKVNRERNFWVYKHPLFHRDKPHDLHLLRRRTCPGVDGRKVRPETELSNMDTGFHSPGMVSPVPPEGASDSDVVPIEPEKKKRKYTSRKKADASLLTQDGILRTLDEENDVEVNKKHTVETIQPAIEYMTSSADRYMRGPSRLVSPISLTCPADLKEQSLLVSKVSRQLDEHAKRAALNGKKSTKKRIGSVNPTFVSDTLRYHALTYDDEIEIYDSARGCVVERSAKNDISEEDVSDDDSENNATVISFNESEVSANVDRIFTAPVQDVNVINRVVSKLLSSDRAINTNSFVAIAAFCMRTDPHDPSLGEKAIQLMSNHADLAQEFCRYKIALSPNNNHAEFMKDMFRGESEDTIRGFKTFVLNSLNDLVRQSETSAWTEFDDLTKCYNVWFSGVTTSA